MTDINWEEEGIKFSVVPLDRADEAVQFMYDYFLPDEPLFRSLGFNETGNTRIMRWMTGYYLKDEGIKNGTSIMATNKEGRIIGLRMGKRSTKKQAFEEKRFLDWLSWLFPFFVWEYFFGKLAHLMRLMRDLKYEPHKAYAELNCDTIYEGISVVVAKDARVRGLGTELVKRSMDLAEKLGCDYMKLLATGDYSSKIFFRLNFTLQNQYEYKDFKDFDGNTMLNDTREHKYGRVFYKKLNKKDEEEKKNE